MRTIITAMLLLLAFSAPSQAAKFYKWVDKDGVTHYTAQPPNDKPAETLNLRTGESRSAEKTEAEPDTKATAEAKDNTPKEPEPESAPPPKTAQKAKDTKDPERCEKASSIRETLVNNNRVKVKDEETGEYTYKSQEELEQWREKNAEDIRKYCP